MLFQQIFCHIIVGSSNVMMLLPFSLCIYALFIHNKWIYIWVVITFQFMYLCITILPIHWFANIYSFISGNIFSYPLSIRHSSSQFSRPMTYTNPPSRIFANIWLYFYITKLFLIFFIHLLLLSQIHIQLTFPDP